MHLTLTLSPSHIHTHPSGTLEFAELHRLLRVAASERNAREAAIAKAKQDELDAIEVYSYIP